MAIPNYYLTNTNPKSAKSPQLEIIKKIIFIL